MGLYQSSFRFDDALPDLDAVRAEVRRRLGSDWEIEGLEIEGRTVIARSMLGPFTHPVLCAVLVEMGGQPVSYRGEPIEAAIPSWAHRPIREMRWRDRMSIRFGWWAWLFGTARPR